MDRINANVFRQMKDKKHGKPVYDIYAKPKKPSDKKFTSPTGKYSLYDKVPNSNQKALPSGNTPQDFLPDDVDLYYADPNKYSMTKTTVDKNGVITRTNGSGVTTIQALVNNPKNKNQPEAWQYKIRTQKMEDPDLDIDSNALDLKKKKCQIKRNKWQKWQVKF